MDLALPVDSCRGFTVPDRGPRVSVVMPTFKQEMFILRALESLLAQTFEEWELIVIDDASPDGTARLLEPYLADARVRYLRNDHNLGLGACLNLAVQQAHGEYLAYLPSDDVYFVDHLDVLVRMLDADPDLYLAYGGVQTGIGAIFYDDPSWLHAATLQGDDVVGREAEVLAAPKPPSYLDHLKSGNMLALVQVMHRRGHDRGCPWAERTTVVSDTLEADQWRALLAKGARFGYAGRVTCQWVQHPKQRHRIIGGTPNGQMRMVGGLSMYRAHYEIPAGQYLNWRPASGFPIDERARAESLARLQRTHVPAATYARSDPLRILFVGELGFNPERILSLEHAGHHLAGLWLPEPEVWTSAGPFPWGAIRDLDHDDWLTQARAFAPDIVYAGLNWQALPLAEQVLDAGLDAPLVLHFKEGPGYAYTHGMWPRLVRLLRSSAGRVFINDECRRWLGQAVGEVALDALIMDGDLPPVAYFTDEFREKLSDRDGLIHTVCAGRWMGLDDWQEIVKAGIHVHIYGDINHGLAYGTIPRGVETGHVHLHETIGPDRWVSELSQYDAGWLHPFVSTNGGDLRAATWSDLNYPGRLATYACAGLPWILYDNASAGSVTAIEQLARRLDVGLPFRDMPELARTLSDRPRMRELTANMTRHRQEFSFEGHLDELIGYFRDVIRRHRNGPTPD
ncbi:glycosyltransferase family 2 protein [Micromonospora sp. NPDC051141]|uniref:glycosyltransferase family 2 protein n=1 Tax=Micromonospora sp. NPDC051141 TaxID=3364284 RepID=UPI0037909B99